VFLLVPLRSLFLSFSLGFQQCDCDCRKNENGSLTVSFYFLLSLPTKTKIHSYKKLHVFFPTQLCKWKTVLLLLFFSIFLRANFCWDYVLLESVSMYWWLCHVWVVPFFLLLAMESLNMYCLIHCVILFNVRRNILMWDVVVFFVILTCNVVNLEGDFSLQVLLSVLHVLHVSLCAFFATRSKFIEHKWLVHIGVL
jgi:hypothetical protein